MLVFNFSLFVESHLLSYLVNHLVVVALQLCESSKPLFLYLHLALYSCKPVHFLLVIFLCFPFPRLLEPFLESKGCAQHIVLDTPLAHLFFLILYTLRETTHSCEKLRIIFHFTSALLNHFWVGRAQFAQSTRSGFFGLPSVIYVESLWVGILQMGSLSLLCPWVVRVNHLWSDSPVGSLWELDRWSQGLQILVLVLWPLYGFVLFWIRRHFEHVLVGVLLYSKHAFAIEKLFPLNGSIWQEILRRILKQFLGIWLSFLTETGRFTVCLYLVRFGFNLLWSAKKW